MHINFTQTITTVDAIDINTKEPSQDIQPYHSDFPKTSQSLPGRDHPPLQDMVGLKSRLSTIVRLDAIAFFRNNREEYIDKWLSLVQMTTFPRTIASSNPRLLEAFTTLESVIARSQVTHTLARFAHFRLVQLIDFLKNVIQSKREKRQLRRERGHRNTSYALDIYQRAQKHPLTEKRKLINQIRLSRRWMVLAGPSPFFLMIYSGMAQAVV